MILLVMCVCVLAVSTASASLLTNGGFEAPALGEGNWDGTNAPADWSWAGTGAYHWIGDPAVANAVQPYEGVQHVEMGQSVALDQNVTHTVLADKLYTFSIMGRTFSDVNNNFVLWLGWDGWSDYINVGHWQSTSAWEEFSITLDEINFGLGVSDALKNFVHRVECQDLNFFVIAVILQRETGGNLVEIMENIAYLIRERYKLFGKVRTLAAEGKLSMYVLLALPFFIIGALFIVNPEYIKMLFIEPAGRIMCGIALFMMLLGAIVMRKMVNIKV